MASRVLTMKMGGGIVRHLGLAMYSGAVPAIAELISNAWDADATEVDVTLPLDRAISPDATIDIVDNGDGMTFKEVDTQYLVVGRNRRRSGGDRTRRLERPILGRKGLGKLAGFGIAKVVEVWTVKDGTITGFRMDFDELVDDDQPVRSYKPRILADREVRASDPLTRSGTLVRLKNLQLKQAISDERFRRGMARRFALLSANFTVRVNGAPLHRDELALQFRYPKDAGTWQDEDVPGFGTVRWWMGFTKKPIEHDEWRGVSVIARGKLVQAPFFFDQVKGTEGQHGLQYLTGEVAADQLDTDSADLIATDRASVLWEDPSAEPLLQWGQQKIRFLLRDWNRQRQVAQIDRLRASTKYLDAVQKFPDRERDEILAAIDKLSSIPTIDDQRLDELVEILLRAYENEAFFAAIKALSRADVAAPEALVEVIEEWDVMEAIASAKMVRGRVEVIRAFRRMIGAGIPEKPDMQEFLKKHPWLLDPKWDALRHESSLDTVLRNHFRGGKTTTGGRRRVDHFCLGDSSMAVVVEDKRPGETVGREELRQLEDYVDHLTQYNQGSTGDQRVRSRVTGVLIYSKMGTDASPMVERLQNAGIRVVRWDQLAENAERLHREFLEVITERAPQDDPRIVAMRDLDVALEADQSANH